MGEIMRGKCVNSIYLNEVTYWIFISSIVSSFAYTYIMPINFIKSASRRENNGLRLNEKRLTILKVKLIAYSILLIFCSSDGILK